MKKIQILDRYSNAVLFEYECKDNTILKTLEEAVKDNANLKNANLENAYLKNANLENANLENANLDTEHISKIKHIFQIIPEIGQFVAWKKASGQVIKIQIPAKAKRTCNLINRKCRAEFVKTLAIQNMDGSKSGITNVKGDHDNKTIYEVGKITKADSFNDDMKKDCTHGIHFFISRKEAENW